MASIHLHDKNIEHGFGNRIRDVIDLAGDLQDYGTSRIHCRRLVVEGGCQKVYGIARNEPALCSSAGIETPRINEPIRVNRSLEKTEDGAAAEFETYAFVAGYAGYSAASYDMQSAIRPDSVCRNREGLEVCFCE